MSIELWQIEAVIAAYVDGAYRVNHVTTAYAKPRPIDVKRCCIQFLCDRVGINYGAALDYFGAELLDSIDTEISRRSGIPIKDFASLNSFLQ